MTAQTQKLSLEDELDFIDEVQDAHLLKFEPECHSRPIAKVICKRDVEQRMLSLWVYAPVAALDARTMHTMSVKVHVTFDEVHATLASLREIRRLRAQGMHTQRHRISFAHEGQVHTALSFAF